MARGIRIARVALAALTLLLAVQPVAAQRGQFDRAEVNPADEAYIFTPPGFSKPGQPATINKDQAGFLEIEVLDADTGKLTWCRVNVIGSDGNYYQPAENPLAEFNLRGHWPEAGSGNRPGKAPIRYFGRSFYTSGKCRVAVPPGDVSVEACRGFGTEPARLRTTTTRGAKTNARIAIQRAIKCEELGYYAGDPHLHFPRLSESDDARVFDLLAAEEVRFGIVMCYNETDAYAGSMSTLVMPQRALGRRSEANRDGIHIVSGQEFRNGVYGHLNLFMRDDLVLAGQTTDPNRWPIFGVVGAQTKKLGGYAIHAHGGYAQEVYADLAQRATTGVELLQFGIYRGVGLGGWYHILNAGFRFPAVGASDYPACRKLADCQTYVRIEGEPSFDKWLRGMRDGKSFVSTGPIVLLEVDGKGPGEQIEQNGKPIRPVWARARVRSVVAPVTHVQLIVNGRVAEQRDFEAEASTADWLTLETELTIDRSSWIAARAFSTAPSGSPDAEAHTNPVYVYVDGRAPYGEADVEWLAAQIDGLIADQQAREFPERDQVVEYFQASRRKLDEIREAGGQPAPEAEP